MKSIKYFFTGIKSIINFIITSIKYIFIGIFKTIRNLITYITTGIKFIFSKKENNKKIEKKFIPVIILTLSVATYLISIFILTRWYVQSERTKYTTNKLQNTPITEDTPDQYEDLTNIEPTQDTNTNNQGTNYIDDNFTNINLNYYTQKNPETVGWIKVNGTRVQYPVVQHSDNDFYLEHDFYQYQTTNGWVFGDYRDNFEKFNDNTIIYGHNLINGTMFGTIPYLLNNNWFNNPNNHYIKLSTKTTNSVWQIFSVYRIEPTTDYLQSQFNSIEARQNFFDMLKNRSVHNFDVELNYTDKIITLSTCDNIGTHRVAVHAKLIKIEDK